MARIVGRARTVERNGMRIQFSELIVIVAVVIAVIAGLRWYFVVYKNSPAFALGTFFGAVKAGDVEAQYEMLDQADKKYFPTKATYTRQMPLARGYTARIIDVNLEPEQIDPKKPNVATIDITISVRGVASGKSLIDSNTQTVKDQYVLRKDSGGKWRIWLDKSKRELPAKVQPSAEGDPIN